MAKVVLIAKFRSDCSTMQRVLEIPFVHEGMDLQLALAGGDYAMSVCISGDTYWTEENPEQVVSYVDLSDEQEKEYRSRMENDPNWVKA